MTTVTVTLDLPWHNLDVADATVFADTPHLRVCKICGMSWQRTTGGFKALPIESEET